MPKRPLHVAFGKVLREYRTKAGLSQDMLADKADLDRTFIGMLERGTRGPSLESLFALARALDVTPQTLVAKTSADL